jgi:hypothetical protein
VARNYGRAATVLLTIKGFKLAEVCSISAGRIVGSENTTISYRTLLDHGYLTNLDITIA